MNDDPPHDLPDDLLAGFNPEGDAPPPWQSPPAPGFKPWEQRIAPGMPGGGGGPPPADPEAEIRLGQASETLEPWELEMVVNQQTQLLHYPLLGRQKPADGDRAARPTDNAEAWRQFVDEKLFDTRRVTLEHFHLFEWFPLSPGRYHTGEGRTARAIAAQNLQIDDDGRTYYNPDGKASMVRGGIGAVRLRPRRVGGEPHYFMTASSSAVCHEGFPVLVPRRFFGPLKTRLLDEGAVPVTLSGEMRYLDDDAPAVLASRRDLPGLYLHVDTLEMLPQPRAGVTRYLVSVAVSFMGTFRKKDGTYLAYCSFDPASAADQQRAITWLGQFYVGEQHQGVVITDFDEVTARFPDAVFGLPTLLSGQLDEKRVRELLAAQNLNPQRSDQFFIFYREINTQGGNYYEGPITTAGGDFHG